MAQVVEHFPSMHEALGSILSTKKGKRKEKKQLTNNADVINGLLLKNA
jgi:hypothetical protein